MLAKLRSHLTYANVMVTALMFIVLGGGAYAAFRLPADSVKSKHIAPDAAQGVDINEASLDTSVLQSRVGGTCQEGQAIQSVFATGQVTCETALQGDPGTPGAPGQPGAPGAPGQPGAPGADGTSFTWQGPWEEGREYAPNDVVSYQGSSWIATKGEPCEPGSEGCTQWDLLAQKGKQGQDGSSDTAQQILDKLKGVDGSTSGLDADKLDNLDSTAFLGANAKAADADKLDNLDSTAFVQQQGATFTSFGLGNLNGFGCQAIHNGWFDLWSHDFSNQAAYYRDPFGFVHLQGGEVNKCGTATGIVFTLPAGFRPATYEFRLVKTNWGNATAFDTLQLAPTGDLQTNANAVVLDGITFRCAPSGQNGCP